MTIAVSEVCGQQFSETAPVVRRREEARNPATAYIFETLYVMLKQSADIQ